MKRKYLAIVTLFLIISSCTNNKKPIENFPQENFINKFFERLAKNQSQEAISLIFSSNKHFSQSDVEKVSQQFSSQVSQMGSFIDKTLITSKTVGEDFILFSYFVKYEAQPIRINFIYYRPNENWVIYNFNYDFSMDEELLEAASVHRLKENLIY